MKISTTQLFWQLRRAELRQKRRLLRTAPLKSICSSTRIGNLYFLPIFFLVAASFLALVLKRNIRYHLCDVPVNDLTKYLANYFPQAFFPDRLRLLPSRLYLFPLKIFSQFTRKDYFLCSPFLNYIVIYFSFIYIHFFMQVFNGAFFFLREDYHSFSSCLASINSIRMTFNLVCLQHGNLDLSDCLERSIYPGIRIMNQIVFDSSTKFYLQKINNFSAKFYLSSPPFKFKYIDYSVKNCKLLFVGGGTYDISHYLDEADMYLSSLGSCELAAYYKPHPREVSSSAMTNYSSIQLYPYADISVAIDSSDPWIFIGLSSTVLYDASMAGFLVFLIDEIAPCSSLGLLGNHPIVKCPSNLMDMVNNRNILQKSVSRGLIKPRNFLSYEQLAGIFELTFFS